MRLDSRQKEFFAIGLIVAAFYYFSKEGGNTSGDALPSIPSGGAMDTSNDADILARTIYGEARGESLVGKIAVAWVVKNRASAGGIWPRNIAAVCLQPKQFSCWNSNDPNLNKIQNVTMNDPVFAECMQVALDVITGSVDDPTYGATYYFNPRVVFPSWATNMIKTVVIGNHAFYKAPPPVA